MDGIGSYTEGAWFFVLLCQLEELVVVVADEFSELCLEGGADGQVRRRVNLQ